MKENDGMNGNKEYHLEAAKKDVFRKLWIRLLKVYDDLRSIGWNQQSLDSVYVKAPQGDIVDRILQMDKRGTKRRVLADQKGIRYHALLKSPMTGRARTVFFWLHLPLASCS